MFKRYNTVTMHGRNSVDVIQHPCAGGAKVSRILEYLVKESCEDSHCNITYLMAANEICSSQQCNILDFEAPYDAAYITANTATGGEPY